MTEHVKVYGVKPRIQYVADGELTTYDFPFATFKASDIEVYLNDIKQASNTYTVLDAGSSDGGSVVFNSAPTSGTIITIIRNLSIERTSDFQEGSTLRAKVLNDELDYQIACTQQIAENLNRSMVLPPYATDNDLDLTLPVPSAGKAIVWNSDGTNLENSTVAVNDLESTLKGYKTAAESAATTATTKAGIASDKADIATEKAQIALTKADEATSAANKLAEIRTNCITKIPQSIGLELDNFTLTLKAGSKVYVPNGSGVFDEVVIANDVTTTRASENSQWVVFYTGSGISTCLVASVFSGTVAPSGQQYMLWYDTTNNLVKYTSDSGSTWSSGYSLPIALVSTNASGISSINQIFNGFGYIGSTIYALPGITGLIPNGRNEDGTLKSTEFTVNNVLTVTSTNSNRSLTPIVIKGDEISIGNTYAVPNGYRYLEHENILYINEYNNTGYAYCGDFEIKSSQISLFKPSSVFHPISWRDKEIFISWGMPDFTSGVSFSSGNSTQYPCFVHIEPVWNGQTSDLTTPLNTRLAGSIYGGANNYKNDAYFICDAGTTITFTNATCMVYKLKGV